MAQISIIIPAYNEEKYIAKCLDTLLAQSVKNFEIIVVDDDSGDNTYSIVEGYAKTHKNIHLFKQNRGGPGRARNLGAGHAKGKILIFVDSDMEFDKDYVKNLIRPIKECETIGTFHLTEYVANKQNIWASCWGTKRIDPNIARKGNIFRAILKSEFQKAGGFNPAKGTFDDNSVGEKIGALATAVEDAICYHNNPTTLSEIFRQIKWISGSFIVHPNAIKGHIVKRKKMIFLGIILIGMIFFFIYYFQLTLMHIFAAFLSIIILLSAKKAVAENNLKYFFALPVFYTVWISGFIYGMLVQIMKLSILKGEYKY